MKYLKSVLLLLCVISLFLVSCDNGVKKYKGELVDNKNPIENPDYDEEGLDYLTPDPERQNIEIYWTYAEDPGLKDDDYITLDVKDETIGFNGKAKDFVYQTIKQSRVDTVDGKQHFTITMGLNYANNDHVYTLKIRAISSDRTILRESQIVKSKKTEGSRLSFTVEL